MSNGKIEKINNFNIEHLNRLYNTSIIGAKRLNIKDNVFAFFVKEALKLRNTSSTFFVSSKDEAYMIYSLSKKMKRRVVMLSPSFLPFIEDESIDSLELMNCHVDYSSYISNNYIVVVDVEYINNKDFSDRFIESILSLIEKNILDTSRTELKEHNIYFSDAHLYSDYISDLSYYAREYNTSLFFFVRQYTDTIYEEKLRFLINSSINKVVLPTAYIKDKFELLGDNNSLEEDDDVVLIVDNARKIADIDFKEKEFIDEFFNIQDKEIRSIKKTLEKKKIKIENNLRGMVTRNINDKVLLLSENNTAQICTSLTSNDFNTIKKNGYRNKRL